MNWIDHDDTYELSTGKRFYAFSGSLGIAERYGQLSLTYGSDGDCNSEQFTALEREEIAEYMVRRWLQWASLGK